MAHVMVSRRAMLQSMAATAVLLTWRAPDPAMAQSRAEALVAIAVPGGFRPPGIPMGITLIAPAIQGDLLVDLALAFQRQSGLRLGTTADTAIFPLDSRDRRSSRELCAEQESGPVF
jgi:Asp-tRNA(Asn)/Glu-tRNA(Gln) amidotransferase A subunit family amidase